MGKFISVLLILILCFGTASGENTSILGQPFPDFTAEDTQGGQFSLSESLKNHDAVLINIWASWCPPCEAEFPYLNEAYLQYGDRVAFIALSCEEDDTPDVIGEYRTAHGISFPMGRDENQFLSSYLLVTGIPTTVIVDRFGNAAYMHVGSFRNAGEIMRVIDAFLGDGYTETSVLDRIPADASTRAYPASAARNIVVENENARAVVFRLNGGSETLKAYSVNDGTAHLRLEPSAADFLPDLVCYDAGRNMLLDLEDLLDSERNLFVLDRSMPGPDDPYHYTVVYLLDYSNADSDPDMVILYLISGDAFIGEFADEIKAGGYSVTWEFLEPEDSAAMPPQSYILHVTDQNGVPVSGVSVQFCTDTSCAVQKSDANGTVSFGGGPDNYHIRILRVPDSYGFDENFEMAAGPEYGEWVLRIRKN